MSSETQAVEWSQSDSITESPLFADAGAIFDSVQEIVGRKWHLRIIYQLLDDGPMGFSALKSEIDGISSKMLSESLAALEDRKLIERQLLSDQPVRVEYSVTEAGSELDPIISALLRWGNDYDIERTSESH